MAFDPFTQKTLMSAYSKMQTARPAPVDYTLEQLKTLAGITPTSQRTHGGQDNITVTASEKSEYMKAHNIRPGTDEWFRLWFAKPYLTGENPFGRK